MTHSRRLGSDKQTVHRTIKQKEVVAVMYAMYEWKRVC